MTYTTPSFCTQAFSVFFICVAFTSDIICLLFIPVQWLFFAASTYVWVQYVWHTGQSTFYSIPANSHLYCKYQCAKFQVSGVLIIACGLLACRERSLSADCVPVDPVCVH